MKRIPILIIKWLANKLGYKTAMIKIGGKVPCITIEGDKMNKSMMTLDNGIPKMWDDEI